MEEPVLGDDLPLPPAALLERLSQINGYTWDESVCAGIQPGYHEAANMAHRFPQFTVLMTTGMCLAFAIPSVKTQALLMALRLHLPLLHPRKAHPDWKAALHSDITGAALAMPRCRAGSRRDKSWSLPGIL